MNKLFKVLSISVLLAGCGGAVAGQGATVFPQVQKGDQRDWLASCNMDALLRANYGEGNPVPEFQRWAMDNVQSTTISGDVVFNKNSALLNYRGLVESIIPAGKTCKLRNSLYFPVERTIGSRKGSEIYSPEYGGHISYIDIFPIQDAVRDLGRIYRQLGKFRDSTGRLMDIVGDFSLNARGELQSDVFLEIGEGGQFSIVDSASIARRLNKRQFSSPKGDLDLDELLSAGYYLGDDFDTAFEIWMEGILHKSMSEDLCYYERFDSQSKLQDLMDFMIPHSNSLKLVDAVKEKVRKIIEDAPIILEESNLKYIGYESIQKCVLFLKDIDEQLKRFVSGSFGKIPSFVESFGLKENDGKVYINSDVLLRFNSEDGLFEVVNGNSVFERDGKSYTFGSVLLRFNSEDGLFEIFDRDTLSKIMEEFWKEKVKGISNPFSSTGTGATASKRSGWNDAISKVQGLITPANCGGMLKWDTPAEPSK